MQWTTKALKFICPLLLLGSSLAQAQAPLILGADTPITQTALHSEMLKKYGTWLGLFSFCKGVVPEESLMMSIGFHLTFAPDVLIPLQRQQVNLEDPLVFSVVQSRHLFIQERASEVLKKIALDGSVQCENYHEIEEEAQRFFKVKGISTVALKSVENLKSKNKSKPD